MKKMYVVTLALFLFVFVGMVGMAKAAVESVAVSATVLEACSFSGGPGAMVFGNYDGSAPVVAPAATLNLNCVVGSTYNIADDDGSNPPYQMDDGLGNLLAYTTSWVDELGTVSVGPRVISIVGTIAAGQFKPAGGYTDTITFTVTY